MQSTPRVFFPTLDSLRALCFLSVFFYHGFYTTDSALKTETWRGVKFGLFGNGNIGVNVFFVLSGFLITYLLVVERRHFGKIDVRRFGMRRILRIWPLYYACVLFGFLGFPLLKSILGQVPSETASPLMYTFFLGNFDLLAKGLPDASILGVLWSIAIEEQFYLFWPVLLLIVPGRAHLWLVGAMLFGSYVFRFFVPSGLAYEVHTLSCMGDMAIGAMAALLSFNAGFVAFFRDLRPWMVVVVNGFFVLVYFARSELFGHDGIRVVERSLVACSAALVLLYQVHGKGSFFKLPAGGVLPALGRISYGLYCLHMVGILVAIQVLQALGLQQHTWQVLLLQPLVGLALTIVLALASHRYLEQPFLHLKERFARVRKA